MRNNFAAKIIAGVFFVLLLFVVVYKAIYLPIIHDEKATSLYYPHFPVWQIMMYTDNWPNNHILNTLLIKAEEHLLGYEPWMIRLHSVLAFVLLYMVVYLIAVRYFAKRAVLFCLPFFIIFCNPYLIDFYGLARGYALANALMVCSIYTLLRFSKTYKQGWYYLTIVLAMLAAYANFTLLIYWVAVHILLLAMQLIYAVKTSQPVKRNIIQFLITGVIAFAFLALCYPPLYKMQSTNQFVYWAKDSFFGNTLVDELIQFWYNAPWGPILSPWACARQVVVMVIIAGIISAYKMRMNLRYSLQDPLVISFLLLFAVIFVNLTQTALLGTAYLSGRTGICYYFLFAWVIIFLFRYISLRSNVFMYVALPVFIALFSWHLYSTVTLHSVREWSYDMHTYEVQDYLNDYRHKHPGMDTIDLNTTWIFNPSFGFYCETGKTPWLNLSGFHNLVDTNSQTLFYYATYNDALQIKGYTVVKNFQDVGNVLMIKK